MVNKLKLGILVSGNGTNLQAIIDNSVSGKINAEIKIVISDNKDAFALKRAADAGIPTAIHLRNRYTSNVAFEDAMARTLEEHDIDLVCLAGFMRILSPRFLKNFPGRMINIHPSLLPSFPGLNAQEQALKNGTKISGCTVHFVNEGIDAGPIILQAKVPVMEDDTRETLAARILEQEHRIYSEAIELFAEGQLDIGGKSVVSI